MWRLLSRKDIAGAAFVAVVVGALLVGYVLFWPGYSRVVGTRAGLGPDWDCTYPGRGDPVCVKKVKPD
jgi:hypothetical protein